MSPTPAVFLDRDGTINVDTEYTSDPKAVRLVNGAAEAIARLNRAGLPVIVVTNQSGIARGYFTQAQYDAVRHRIDELLDEQGAHLDGTYMCPHSPTQQPPCDCRKPKPGLYERAAREHDLDLARCWYIGDRLRDVQCAAHFGGHGILIARATTPWGDVVEAKERFAIATTLEAAVDRVLG